MQERFCLTCFEEVQADASATECPVCAGRLAELQAPKEDPTPSEFRQDVPVLRGNDFPLLGGSPSAGRSRVDFGKYKGKLIADVPTDYLEWAVETCQPRIMIELFRCELQYRSLVQTLPVRAVGKSVGTECDIQRATDFTLPASSPHDVSLPWEDLT